MTTNIELRNQVILAAEEFYLDKKHGMNWTDLEYDDALDKVKESDPDFDIFREMKGTTGLTVFHQIWFPGACKTKINEVSWLLPVIKYSTLKQLHASNAVSLRIGDGYEDTTVIGVAHYIGGNLRRVTVHGLGDINGSWVIKDLPKVIPNRLKVPVGIKGSDAKNLSDRINQSKCRVVFALNTDQIVPIPMVVGIISDWCNQLSWSDIRQILVGDDHFTSMCLSHINAMLDERILEVIDRIKDDEWYFHTEVPFDIRVSPKMDGCSVVVYYKDSKLDYIASRSNDVTGKCKTQYLYHFFPDCIPGIGDAALMMECVIDLAHGFDWNSRQKANGLINSKYKLGEVAKYSTFVVYDAVSMNSSDTPRLGLSALQQAINEHALNSRFCRFIQDNKTDGLEGITNTSTHLKNHLCAVHGLPKDILNLEDELVYFKDLSDFNIGNTIDVFGTLNEQQIREINDDQVYINKFEHGVLNGYRYAYLEFDDDYIMWVFAKTDLKPKLTVVTEFPLVDYHKYVSSECQAHYHHHDGGTYLIDGLVEHTMRPDRKRAETKGFDKEHLFPFHNVFKWTYNEIVETEIEATEWQESGFSTYIPVARFRTILVEGSWLSRASTGGFALAKKRGVGVGAKVTVVRMNSTIPIILQVKEPAPVELPACPHCGNILEEYTTLGGASLVKCGNEICTGKIKQKNWLFDPKKGKVLESISTIDLLPALIPIEAFKPNKDTLARRAEEIRNLLENGTIEQFKQFLSEHLYVGLNRDKQNSFDNIVDSAFIVYKMKQREDLLKESLVEDTFITFMMGIDRRFASGDKVEELIDLSNYFKKLYIY